MIKSIKSYFRCHNEGDIIYGIHTKFYLKSLSAKNRKENDVKISSVHLKVKNNYIFGYFYLKSEHHSYPLVSRSSHGVKVSN